MAYDDPASIQHDEARQELLGRPSAAGIAAYEVVLIAASLVGGAIAFEEIDHWSQWIVLEAILFTLLGLMIALSPTRRGI